MATAKQNIIFENIKIIDTSSKGKSVGKLNDGRIIFIENGVPGDIVNVKVLKKRKGVLEGKIDKMLSPSAYRIDPK